MRIQLTPMRPGPNGVGEGLESIRWAQCLWLMQAGVAAGIRCFVYSSSLLVYRGSRSMVDARTPADPVLDYGRIKVETEKRLLEIARLAGISFSALRLPHVYGLRDLYFRQMQARRLILPGLGRNTYTHLHVADAAIRIHIRVKCWR